MRRALPFAVALMAVGMVGMVGARQGVAGDTAPMPVVERGDHQFPIFDRYSPTVVQHVSVGAVSTSAAPDWLPTPEPGRVLEPGETVRVIPLEVWRASLVISEKNQYALLRITACESGGTWDTTLRGAAGEEGVAQVIARFWGPVPTDLRGQFEQADRIYTEHGDWPWSTRSGCALWSAD